MRAAFRALLVLLPLALGPGTAHTQPAAPSAAPDSGPPIAAGSTVRLEYVLTDDAGTVLDSNKGREPLTYRQGERQIIPGLEEALAGMHAGDEKQVTVKPEDGYGRLDPAAQTEVPKELIPADSLTVGTRLVARSPDGDTRLVRIKEVRESTVIIDLNHPLAGMTLHFAVKVLEVEPPPTE